MNSVFEIAINQSKEGQHDVFLETRKKFVDILGKEASTLNEGKWLPFFAVPDTIDLKRVLIGMTHWRSMEEFGEAAARLVPQKEGRDYFASFDPLAYAILEPIDGKSFDFNTIKTAGSVVEFAIRKAVKEGAFGTPRNRFFDTLNNFEGYGFSREFKVHKLDESGMPKLAEETQAVIIVWDNERTFNEAAEPIFKSEEYHEFMEYVDVENYFVTSPVSD